MKPTDITPKVKKAVWERDAHCCVICGAPVTWNSANAHVFVRRSHGGLGIPENIATLCWGCHRAYDQGKDKESNYIKSILHEYMHKQYPNLKIEELK